MSHGPDAAATAAGVGQRAAVLTIPGTPLPSLLRGELEPLLRFLDKQNTALEHHKQLLYRLHDQLHEQRQQLQQVQQQLALQAQQMTLMTQQMQMTQMGQRERDWWHNNDSRWW